MCASCGGREGGGRTMWVDIGGVPWVSDFLVVFIVPCLRPSQCLSFFMNYAASMYSCCPISCFLLCTRECRRVRKRLFQTFRQQQSYQINALVHCNTTFQLKSMRLFLCSRYSDGINIRCFNLKKRCFFSADNTQNRSATKGHYVWISRTVKSFDNVAWAPLAESV